MWTFDPAHIVSKPPTQKTTLSQRAARPEILDETNFRESVLPFVGRRSLDTETPIHCLAVRVRRRWDEQIDTNELEDFLDQTAGPNRWLMTSLWMFARQPVVMRPCFQSVPVICPVSVAARLSLNDCEDRPQRIFGEHVVGAVELRGWRWVAGQVYPQFGGQFPWELEGQVVQHA